MGTVSSKIEDEMHQEEIAEGSVPSTPILTPKIKVLRELDPRSPSNNVIRTPIETVLMKHTNVKNAAPLSVVQCTPRLKYLNIDPRSPTVDFNRTPIVIPETENKGNLESPPIINVPEASSRRKSYVLLETNLDYIETDIDVAYLRNNILQRESTENESFADAKSEIDDQCDNVVKNEDIESIEKEIDIIHLNVDAFEKPGKGNQVVEVVPENLLGISDGKFPFKKVLSRDISADAESFSEDLTVVLNNVKDLDKKLTNLIYEDKNSPVIRKDDTTLGGDRTPLAIRNGNMDTRKKLPKLKVLDRPKKYSHRQFSKIPVSNQCRKNKINIQCENTPPKNFREKKEKAKKTGWDADKTLII